MNKKSILLATLLACLAIAVIAAPKIEFSWKNPTYGGQKFKNVIVLALNGKAANRAEFEDELVAAISRPGTQVSPSYDFIARPDATPIDMNDMRELVREQKIDAIVVARLTKKDTKTTYVPGQLWTPFPYYGTFYGYYGAIYSDIYTPGYMETEKEAQVEVNMYSTAKPDGELVWTGTTNTFDAGSVKKALKGLVKTVSEALEKEDIIPKEGK